MELKIKKLNIVLIFLLQKVRVIKMHNNKLNSLIMKNLNNHFDYFIPLK